MPENPLFEISIKAYEEKIVIEDERHDIYSNIPLPREVPTDFLTVEAFKKRIALEIINAVIDYLLGRRTCKGGREK